MKSFLICPVRGMSPDAHRAAVSELEAQGYTVHWPPRDTDQNDEVGLRICRDNAAAIASADVVHVIWDGKSQGCLFDLGVAFALGKKVEPIVIPALSEGKSFQNMIAAWACDGPALISNPGAVAEPLTELAVHGGRQDRPNRELDSPDRGQCDCCFPAVPMGSCPDCRSPAIPSQDRA